MIILLGRRWFIYGFVWFFFYLRCRICMIWEIATTAYFLQLQQLQIVLMVIYWHVSFLFVHLLCFFMCHWNNFCLMNSFKHVLNLHSRYAFRGLIFLLYAVCSVGYPRYDCIGIIKLFQALSMMTWFVLLMITNTSSSALALLSS